MKKVKFIIAVALAVVLVAGAIGVVFAADKLSANTNAGGSIVYNPLDNYSPLNGIRWNPYKEVFEVFNYRGVSAMGSDVWFNAVGEEGQEKEGAVQATITANYNIMKDIPYDSTAAVYKYFKTSASDFGTSGSPAGIIDGRGFTFKNFPVRGYYGLYSNFNGTMRNLNLDFGTTTIITNNFYGIFNSNYGVIENCTVTGSGASSSVIGFYASFGNVNSSTGIIRNCTNYFSIGNTGVASLAAGFVYYNYGEIIGCINQANIKAARVAGIVINHYSPTSYPNAKILNCTNNGNITAIASTSTDAEYNTAAGITYALNGNVNYVIQDCVNIGRVESLSASYGSASGIFGAASDITLLRATLADCYNNTNDGTVTSGRGISYAFSMYKGVTGTVTKD